MLAITAHPTLQPPIAETHQLASSDTDGHFTRDEIARADLGGGLASLTIAYRLCEEPGAPILDMGQAEGFALRLADDAEISIEVDSGPAAQEWHRRVTIAFPNGDSDSNNSPRELLQLAELLRHDRVYAALVRWAAEDAATDAMTA